MFYDTFIDVTPCPPLLHDTYREGISEEFFFFKSRNLPVKEKYVNDTYYLKIHKTKWFLSIKVFTFTDPYPNPQNPGIYSEVKFKQKLFLRNLSHSETCQNQFQFHHLFPFYVRDANRHPPSPLPPLYQSLYKLQFISDGFGCNTDPCKTNFTDLFIAQHTMWSSAPPLTGTSFYLFWKRCFPSCINV